MNSYKILFLLCIFIGSVVNLGSVLDFSDILALVMSLLNLLGCFFMSGLIARELKNYMSRTQVWRNASRDDRSQRTLVEIEEVNYEHY
ncbi:alanine:cation symporter family protein [Myxosarcina sp. GI1(2024)]